MAAMSEVARSRRPFGAGPPGQLEPGDQARGLGRPDARHPGQLGDRRPAERRHRPEPVQQLLGDQVRALAARAGAQHQRH